MIPLTASGVYVIRNRVNGKVYVGSSSRTFALRRKDHFESLRSGKHFNPYLQRAWDKYGEEAFEYEPVEECLPDDCLAKEQQWIDALSAVNRQFGYNIALKAGSPMAGKKHTDEARKKIAAAGRGRRLSEESRRKIGDKNRVALTGRTLSAEHRAKVSKGLMESELHHRLSVNAGRKLSEEHKAAIGAAAKGNTYGLLLKGTKKSPETRRRMSEAQRGRKLAEDTCQKMSAITRQLWQDPEYRKKMMAARKLAASHAATS